MNKLESILKENILSDLERGRPNWDAPHTLAVVKHIKNIIKNNSEFDLDEAVLIIAAYAHDWGYVGMFDETIEMKDIGNAKKAHMELGARKLEKLLKDDYYNFLSKKQKSRAVHLVKVHDKLSRLNDIDELVLMEADTLAGMDVGAVEPTLSVSDLRRYISKSEKNRVSKFITKYSKDKVQDMLKKYHEYIDKLSE